MNKKFFAQDAERVARELLGKVLIRNINGKEMRVRIVETEAYFGEEDPASRACQNGDLKKTMQDEVGTILVYGVHNNWLINLVTGEKGKAEAVLLRAVEPLNFQGKTSGPGLLTKALKIDKSFHKKNLVDNEEIMIIDAENEDNGFEIIEAFRVGVREDLKKPLRFYIKDNGYVSRK